MNALCEHKNGSTIMQWCDVNVLKIEELEYVQAIFAV